MAGYADDFSMSNNALHAYDRGLLPASKIKGVPAALIDAHCRYEEWHHSSKHFNRVKFYDPGRVRATFGLEPSEEWPADPLAVAALAAHKAASKSVGEVYHNCRVEWIEWGGTLRQPKAYPQVAEGCTVAVKGQTASITLPDGGNLTKRLTTNGFSFRPAPAPLTVTSAQTRDVDVEARPVRLDPAMSPEQRRAAVTSMGDDLLKASYKATAQALAGVGGALQSHPKERPAELLRDKLELSTGKTALEVELKARGRSIEQVGEKPKTRSRSSRDKGQEHY